MGNQRRQSGKAAVASGHEAVTRAAVEVLRAGGNAFDAVLAAGFAGPIAEPALTSLGGGGFLLAHTSSGESTLLDFFCDTPGRGASRVGEMDFRPLRVPFGDATQVFHIGAGACAVPGVLAGYLETHARFGRLELRDIVAPGVRAAREGVALNRSQAFVNRILGPIFLEDDESRAMFAPGGELLGEGGLVRSEAYAAFLEDVSEGRASLSSGPIGARIEQVMRERGGLLTRADLGAYRVIEREPLRMEEGGRTILSNPPPSFGGRLILHARRLLERCLPEGGVFDSPEHLCALVGVQREIEKDRELSDEAFEAGRGESAARVRRFIGGTSHVSVIDAEGNAASMTTSNGQGCGVMAPGTGVMLNNMMGEDDLFPGGFHSDAPGVRIASMMSPTIVLEGGRASLVLGSGGSKRIRSAIGRVLSGALDFGLSLEEAVSAPRVHWDGERLQVEPGLSGAALDALGERVPVNVWSSANVFFGGVHAVSGSGEAFADWRREGSAAVLGG
ncbi:MAG: gamma-glutamyltransferase family protein [Phycisphaerales bacterium JB059]